MITEKDIISDKVLTIKHSESPDGVWYWDICIFIAVKHEDNHYYWEFKKWRNKPIEGLFPPTELVELAKKISEESKIPYKTKLSIIRKTKPGSCMYFLDLNEEQTLEFQKYAQENDPDMSKWEIYHPVCRAEWEKRGFKNG